MLRITKLSDYAIILLSHLANLSPGETANTREIARETNVPAAMVGKILKQLNRCDLLVSTRGINGGYALARSPWKISVVELLDALEGPVGLTECAVPGVCTMEGGCGTRGIWHDINRRIRAMLESVSLAEMIGGGFDGIDLGSESASLKGIRS